ncbi:hypothetical protein G6N76_02140 [Rhizobium daejeonense]|uniref:Tyr recombinase domain-containing protein n=1 Tax=Rhizobium daejeonense TaxID=240521 RepID=A0A6M1RTP4_9HYPH|nr:hypothetical protein [Rhizobium daejeonense]NGO62459.1 hypothetical protein [Rhizobium daejeonense]
MDKESFTSMKLKDWPGRDRELWHKALQPGDILDDDVSPASAWRPATRRSTEKAWGTYLFWLETSGSLEPDDTPVKRVNLASMSSFIALYSVGRAELTVAGTVRGIAYMLRATAPPDGMPWLTKLAHRLMNNAASVRPKLPRMVSISDLASLGLKLMADGRAMLANGKADGAMTFRDGLMIAALVSRPMRRRNFAALRLGVSFLVTDAGARVVYPAEETKRQQPIDFFYPDWLHEHFDFYLARVRPILIHSGKSEDAGWLWLGRRGTVLTENSIGTIIGATTEEHLGRRVSPHLFRDCAATDVALHDSSHVGISKSVLGHATLASSQTHYNQATSFAAMRRYQKVLDDFMDEGE